jgi:GT2 family glycosyltransferase
MINRVTIAVIMACFNRKDKTIRCLRSLFQQQGLGQEFNVSVFLVDDGSTDGTGTAVRQEFPEVDVIQGTGNLYWNKGMHLAWSKATEVGDFDYYFWLNDDVKLFDSTLHVLLETHRAAKQECIVCGSTCSELTGKFTYGSRHRTGEVITPGKKIEYGEVMNGNIVLISKKVYLEIGNLDPIFPHAIGDGDYSLRAYKKGFLIAVPPGYQGYCESHEKPPKWCQPEVPLAQRLKSLYSPLGNAHPRYFFIYENRHFGPISAVKHYITIHLRALMPGLWK